MSDLTDNTKALMDLQRTMGRIEAKVDEVLDMERRVSSLEAWRKYLTGAWAVVMAILAYFGINLT